MNPALSYLGKFHTLVAFKVFWLYQVRSIFYIVTKMYIYVCVSSHIFAYSYTEISVSISKFIPVKSWNTSSKLFYFMNNT